MIDGQMIGASSEPRDFRRVARNVRHRGAAFDCSMLSIMHWNLHFAMAWLRSSVVRVSGFALKEVQRPRLLSQPVHVADFTI